MHHGGTNWGNNKLAVPQGYQLFNPDALVRVASATHAVESDNGVSSLIPRKRLVPLDRDLEEASSDQIGNYTCPYLNCPYGNYALGFSTRVERNNHMLNCVYRLHGGSDHNEIPSLLVNKIVYTLAAEAGLNNNLVGSNQGCSHMMNIAGSSSQIALQNYSAPVTPAYSRMEIIPDNNSQFTVEPARELPEINNSQAETGVLENGTHGDQLSGVANNNHFPEVGTSQEGFHYLSPEIGGFLDNFNDDYLTAMDEFLYDTSGWIN